MKHSDQILDLADQLNGTTSLVVAAQMSLEAIPIADKRNALDALLEVILDRLDNCKALLQAVADGAEGGAP